MIYRLKELKGDTIAVPQLIFSKLGIAEEYNVRVALYVLATGITDPDKICADLKLRSRISAESALAFWAGAGLLERYEENAAPGEETGEQADAHLKLLALRQSREQYVSSLLDIAPDELTLGGRKAIARWYEVYGYDDAMVQEAAVQAGPKRDLWYWNSILKTWNAKGLRTVHDVRSPVAAAGASRNIRVDRAAPSGNDILKNATRRRSLIKKPE